MAVTTSRDKATEVFTFTVEAYVRTPPRSTNLPLLCRCAIFRDDVDQERFVERPTRLVGDEAVVLRADVLLDNHLGIATASVTAHLRTIDAETIYQARHVPCLRPVSAAVGPIALSVAW